MCKIWHTIRFIAGLMFRRAALLGLQLDEYISGGAERPGSQSPNKGNPFSTCLVGVPADTWPNTTQSQHLCSSFNACVDNWDGWSAHLPQLPQEPQELELLGSVKMDSCLYFNYSGRNRTTAQNINSSLSIYKNNTAWCNYTSPNISKSSNAPLALPSGIFFICGDHAWGGIPSHIKGGPCSLGRLTLLTPNTSIIFNHRRSKRSTHAFKAECRDGVEFWNSEKIIMASIAAPGESHRYNHFLQQLLAIRHLLHSVDNN
ncbi:uncharacterized protein WM294_015919 [Sarcoramphus papa]